MSASAKQMREQGSGEPRALPSPLVEQRKREITSAPHACCLRVETDKGSNHRVVCHLLSLRGEIMIQSC